MYGISSWCWHVVAAALSPLKLKLVPRMSLKSVEVEGTLFIQPKSSEIRQILCTSKRIQKSSSRVQRVDKDQNTTVRISYGAHAGDDVNEMLQFDLLRY